MTVLRARSHQPIRIIRDLGFGRTCDGNIRREFQSNIANDLVERLQDRISGGNSARPSRKTGQYFYNHRGV